MAPLDDSDDDGAARPGSPVEPGVTIMEKCRQCGNLYMPDAIYCRICGTRRDDCETEFDNYHGGQSPVWQWSRDGLSPGLRRRWCSKEEVKTFRFMDRDSPMGQSLGRWNVLRVASKGARQIRNLYLKDIYHTFIDGSSTAAQFFVYCLMYVVCYLLFAVFYLLISDPCGLAMEGKFVRAYYLSLQTMVTIGYGVPDPYYHGCWQGTILLTCQSIVAFFLNALVIGSVFVRLTRPQNRANTILFSEKACIQESHGALYFVFQVCEAKNHDLVQAHIRCYCIRHDRKGDQAYQTVPLRLQQPDDEHGSAVLLTFPTKIVHRIDNWSPLSPAADELRRKRQVKHVGDPCTPKDAQSAGWAYHWPEVPQRQVDAEQGNRDTCVCEVCGSSFQSFELLRRHTEYNAVQDPLNGVPEELCHKAWTQAEMKNWGWSLVEQRPRPGAPADAAFAVGSVEPTRDDIKAFMNERFIEVVVLVEGSEPTTSANLQAKHSYLFPDDIAWDRDFAKCAVMGQTGELCAVDMSRFNDLVPWSATCELNEDGAYAAVGAARSKSKGKRLVDIISLGSEAVRQAVQESMTPEDSAEGRANEMDHKESTSLTAMSSLLKKAVKRPSLSSSQEPEHGRLKL